MKKTIRKISLFILLVTAVQSLCAQGSWERIPVPTSAYLRSVHFTDSLYGWAAGDSGTIIHTIDGGSTWIHQQSHTMNQIRDIFFLDRNRGWASAFNLTVIPLGTELLKTTNGGAEWTIETYPEEDIFINCILYLDSLRGWMGGSPHALVSTTNGGYSWEQATIDTSNLLAVFPVLSIRFYNDNYGYACGGMFDIAGVTWHTSDGGQMWYPIKASDAPADEVHELHLFDSITVIGAGGDPDFGYGAAMIRTYDGGVNWNYEELGIAGNAFDLDFRNGTEAWAPLGPRKQFIYSLDAGNTWSATNTPDSTAIFDVIFPDSLYGFAVGEEGAMLRYTPPEPVYIKPSVNISSVTILLDQNRPNPFKESTTINYFIPGYLGQNTLHGPKPYVRLEVYDVFGRLFSTLCDRPLPPGKHQVVFNAAGLPAGMYFCQLTISDPEKSAPIRETIKMILRK